MIVEAKLVGGSGLESRSVELPSGLACGRDLVEALVRHEVAAFEQRREASTTLRVLTPADLARGVDSGSYGREPRALPAPPPVDDAVVRAVEAFGDGLFLLLVDDEQVEHLHTPLRLTSQSRVRLIRLVALAGG